MCDLKKKNMECIVLGQMARSFLLHPGSEHALAQSSMSSQMVHHDFNGSHFLLVGKLQSKTEVC